MRFSVKVYLRTDRHLLISSRPESSYIHTPRYLLKLVRRDILDPALLLFGYDNGGDSR